MGFRDRGGYFQRVQKKTYNFILKNSIVPAAPRRVAVQVGKLQQAVQPQLLQPAGKKHEIR